MASEFDVGFGNRWYGGDRSRSIVWPVDCCVLLEFIGLVSLTRYRVIVGMTVIRVGQLGGQLIVQCFWSSSVK